MTMIVDLLWLVGRPSIKSMEMSFQILVGIGKGCNIPAAGGTRANRDTMQPPELRQKTTAASKKRVAATGVKFSTSRKSPNRVSKQRRKASGEKENESGGLHFPSAIPPMSPAVPSSAPGQSLQCFQKFKLQLFPIDELTREGLERDKHNPYLELTLGIRKKISSVVKHLDVKWGNSKMASGELMLFPYYARVESLSNYISWSLKDCDTSVADVHAAIGRPALFRLRYGWSSKLKPKVVGIECHIENKIVHEDRSLCPVERRGHDSAVGSYARDGGVPVPLEKPIESQVNQRCGNSLVNLWDLSNISFGALLSEASANENINAVNCDTFDADVARLKAKNQSTYVPQSSIWDAEETCNAFSFRKITSSRKVFPAQLKNAPVTSSTENVSSSPLRLDNPDKQDDAYREPMPDQQFRTSGIGCSHTPVDAQLDTQNVASEEPKLQLTTEATHRDTSQFRKLYTNSPDSLGPLECVAPSLKNTVGGDSFSLDALLANSLDAFRDVSIL